MVSWAIVVFAVGLGVFGLFYGVGGVVINDLINASVVNNASILDVQGYVQTGWDWLPLVYLIGLGVAVLVTAILEKHGGMY